ncbi:MAG: ABC transporter substrate-binding protein [Thermoleophilia bacterium]|nr:ABC transporter substrate-binding protein [Thermoleophilia bacterium]
MSIEQPISRRDFLKAIGKTGAAVGFGAGLAGLLSGCDETGVSSNTTATIRPGETTTTTTGSTTTTTTTTVATRPEVGRPLRIGLVSARTGPLALLGKADDWWVALGLEAVGEGVVCGDGKLRAVGVSVRDSRSDPAVAARLAADLISGERVDLIMCSGDSAIVNAVADQAQSLECPCLADLVLWQSFVNGRGGSADRPFEWTYAHAYGLEDVVASYLAMWGQPATNKKIGVLLPDDIDGRIWGDATAGVAALATEEGYECVAPGLYPASSTDFAPQIEEFLKNGCEICFCGMKTSDFLLFWRQAALQSYRPKIVTVSGGLRFPHSVEVVGSSALNMTGECLWHPSWPYRDSLTGKSGQELVEDYQAKTGDQWTVALAQYAKFEWAIQVFKKAKNIVDKREVIARVRSARLDTCNGPLDFTRPTATGDPAVSRRPAQNVYKAPVGGAQWVAGTMFPFEPRMVAGVNQPDLPVAGRVQPMVYQA